MTPSFTLATAARVGAMAFAVAAIAAAAVHFREGDRRPAGAFSSPAAADIKDDPLQAELKRCQLLGEAGAHDDVCLRAWAENRRRFFGLAAGSPTAPSTEVAPKPPSPANASPLDAPTASPTPKGE